MVARTVFYIFFIAPVFLSCPLMGQGDAVKNKLNMEFIFISPGSFVVGKFEPPYPVPEDTIKGQSRNVVMYMGEGRPYNEEEFWLAKTLAIRDSRPGFKVQIEHGFYLGKYEVTQGEWKNVMGENPSVFQGGNVTDQDRRPVENVTWEDVQRFLDKLNGMDPSRKYRLATEFEWEYAARAGAKDDIPWSEIQQVAQLGTKTTQVVGGKKPNAWGLYDMLGNVWEWVNDYYNEKIFADPVPPEEGTQHVLKGSSFVGDVKNATYMTHAAGPGNGWDVGFRIVMELKN
jgi:formylglycine-generating enzyme required for sulfatase activity